MSNFSSKYLNNNNILKNAYIGFEFEFYTKKEIPYYNLLEKLNNEFREFNISVQGIRKYHPDTKPTETKFIITPDTSGGANMVELITGKLEYSFARIILLKTLKFIQINGYTTDRSSIHINLSFNGDDIYKSIDKVNKLKMILNVDEDLIYKYFPTRKESYYAKSVKKIIPFKQFNYSNDAVNILQSNLELPDDDRYYGINFTVLQEGRLEFRYLGGESYEKKTSEILDLMDYFIVLSWNCINDQFNQDDIEKLEEYLNYNINIYKNFNNLDNFIGNFPTITLEIDRQSSLQLVSVYYGDIYSELYELITNTFNLSDCIINYDTTNQKLEIIDANIKSIFKILNWVFVDCTINSGIYEKCDFISCIINNSNIHNCNIIDTDAFNSKIVDTNTDELCKLTSCYVNGGVMNGDMPDGILRLTKVGENGIIGDEVKIVDEINDFFGVYNKPDENIKKIPNTGNKKIW